MSLLEIHEPGETPLPHAGEGSLAVGIDLGTTNSVVAIARDGKPAALHDETGRLRGYRDSTSSLTAAYSAEHRGRRNAHQRPGAAH